MPIGIQSFETIRTNSHVYVDKTHFIPKLEVVGISYFLTRPRRFGKSLFISTLQAYFEGRKELFKGLYIERFKEENNINWQTYPVLKLDLTAKEYTEKEQLKVILNDHIKIWETKYCVKTYSSDPDSAFVEIIQLLYNKFNQKVVILIDEYDKPLLATLENEVLHEQYLSTLKAFYSVIKSSNDYIHLSFLTGVTKFSKVSIFSDLNNLIDLSFNREYSTICGITQGELEENFSSEIEELAKKYEVSYSEMIEKLKKKYDGYYFSDDLVGIYNPFSLLNAFYEKRLRNYWFASGTPTFMVKLLEQKCFALPDLEGGIRASARSIDDYRVNYEDITPLLFQSGYLTIKNYDTQYDMYVLGFPNDEVRYAFLYNLTAIYTDGKTSSKGEFRIDKFDISLQAGDIEKVLTLIKALMASIPYDSLPEDKLFLREHNYQTIIYLIFTLMGEYARCEVHSSQGRSDVEVETATSIYIFEFKVGGKPLDAIAQIKKAGYAEKYGASEKKIFLIGATISRNKRTLSKWQIEKVK